MMGKTCPFKFNQTPDYGKGEALSCLSGCALWVESEEMCSFRLLADDVADHKKRVRDAGQEIGTLEELRGEEILEKSRQRLKDFKEKS